MQVSPSTLDRELAGTLKPLADNAARVFVPAFVNTFPLGYHAALAGAAVALSHWDVDRDRALILDAIVADILFVLYTFPQVAQRLRSVLNDRSGASGTFIAEVTSKYRIRRMFARWRDGRLPGSPNGPQQLLHLLGSDTEIDLFSDIPTQANHIVDRLIKSNRVASTRVFKRYKSPVFRPDASRPDTGSQLDLIVCSAPLAHYFGTQSDFFEVEAPDDEYLDAESRLVLDLAVVTWIPKQLPGSAARTMAESLREYHAHLYARFESAPVSEFLCICDCYQRTVRGRSLLSPITEPEVFRQVLLNHHISP